MSKINIDKFFRDQFHAHEKNSGSYSPEHWKNFEQLLDKENKKRNKWGFSLNNLLFFMSSFVIVMLIPLLFLRSDTIMEPDGNTVINKKNNNTVDVVKKSPSATVDPKAKDIVCNENPAETANSAFTTGVDNINFQKDILKAELKISNDSVKMKDVNFNLEIPVKKIQILNEPKSLTIINQPKNKKGKKQNDINATSKKGKIHRSQVLMPDLYYNGF